MQLSNQPIRGMQQSICEATTRTTLKRMGYNSRRPHRVPLISTTNRKKWLQFVWLPKLLPGLMSLDFCWDIQMVVKIWRKQN